jgi:serine phosphatase RsbU (regulator of sigma subunit)
VSRAKLATTLDRVRARLATLTDERDVVAANEGAVAYVAGAALPKIAGFDCAAASLPARGVGGDFYDVFAIAESRMGTAAWRRIGKGVAAGSRRVRRPGPRSTRRPDWRISSRKP